MKYEDILTDKFFKYLEKLKVKDEVLNKEELFFKKLKNIIENSKKE